MTLMALPPRASELHDWIVWASAVIGGLAVIGAVVFGKRSPIHRVLSWLFRRNVGEPVSAWASSLILAVMKPDLDSIHTKVDGLTKRNDSQHAENARALANLRVDLNTLMHRTEKSSAEIHELAASTDETVTAIRHDQSPKT